MQIEAIKRDVKDPILREKLIQQAEEYFKNKDTNYLRKLYLIEKCIYGVDIQQIAVEIAKLRFFISLLVDEKIDKTKPNSGIEPLPNLDFKLMQGNSLISSFVGIDFGKRENSKDKGQLSLGFTSKYDDLIKEFEEIKNQYQNEPDKDKKDNLRGKIEELILQIFKEKISQHFPQLKRIEEKYESITEPLKRVEFISKEKSALYKKLGFDLEKAQKDLIAYTEGRKPKNFFLWNIYFAEVFTRDNPGFDIVIANPPYIKEYINRKVFDGLRDSPYYQGKMDIWYLFACKGVDLLKSAGVFTFIAQNNWVTSYGAKKLREKVVKDTYILELLDFGDYKIFASSGIQTMIMIFKKDSEIDNYTFEYRRIVSDDVDFKDILALINKEPSPKAEYLKPMIKRSKYLNKPLTFNKSIIEDILNKMLERSNVKLYEDEIAQGIVCPQDRVIRSTQKVLGNKFNIGDGIFVLTNEEKTKIPFIKEELKLIKPYYTTRELGRYYVNRNNSEWIIYTDSKFKYPENIKPYPNIKKHLDKFQKVITSDNRPYGLHRARNEKFFKEEKIIGVRKCVRPTFTYTDFDCYVSAAFYVIKTERINLKYLVGLLNSKLIDFWLRHRGKMQGNNYQIDKEPLLSLPIIKPSEDEQEEIISFVNKILSLTQSEDYLQNPQKQAKVKQYERQIDQLVYKLYGLTKEEIEVIERSVST
jgi:adenine-specific DNA-methyltransferase